MPTLDEVRCTRLKEMALPKNAEETAEYVAVDKNNIEEVSKNKEMEREERENEGALDETEPVE